MENTIQLEQVYSSPMERVWRALTNSEAIARWLMPNDFRPELGHKFRFQAQPAPGWDGVIDSEVIELDEPRKLVYTWNSRGMNTVVTWTLEEVNGGTRLRLEHTGFSGPMAAFAVSNMGSGWKGILETRFPAELQ
ncbi:MAG: SRPBCC family protein [Mycobacterium leprae]